MLLPKRKLLSRVSRSQRYELRINFVLACEQVVALLSHSREEL